MKEYYTRTEVKELLYEFLVEKKSPWKREPETSDERIKRFQQSARDAMIKKERHYSEMHTHLKLANDPNERPREKRIHGILSSGHRMAAEGQAEVEKKYRNGEYDADWAAEDANKFSDSVNKRSDAFYMARKLFTKKDPPAK